jgi:hypothetical protein
MIEDPLKLRLVEQPGRSGKVPPAAALAMVGTGLPDADRANIKVGTGVVRRPGAPIPGQGISRARPLARRACKTLRPLRVALRARKPWVRARLRRLG